VMMMMIIAIRRQVMMIIAIRRMTKKSIHKIFYL
jgi:hypothetical protein